MFDLKNKTVIITGGAGLIGSTFSRDCARCNANVVVVDIDEKRGHKLVEQIKRETENSNILFQRCDITNTTDIVGLIDLTLNRSGKIDALVNNAYPRNKNYGRKFEDVSYEDFCENMGMHLGGYFLMTQQVTKVMLKQNYGNIINMASIYG
ncbi:NAD(P)-dependent dehydrogenase, short-chain alcohol dehydrogenase family, partial [Candidatus Methanophagaceae archaeon]